MNDRVITNPNFKSSREFHASLKAKGVGAKDFPNSHTEVEHLGNGKFAASIAVGHKVFFDKADGNKPKKHKLTDTRPGKDYILIQGAKCCVEVYPYYAKYFDVNHKEVRLYEERWVVQRLFKEPDEWRDVGAYNPQIAVEEYSKPAGDVVKVTITYDTDYGPLTVEYFQRDGNNLKHNVTFQNTSGSEETFRVLQRWAGIAGNKVKTPKEEYNITTKKVLAELAFTFGSEESPFGIRENLASMYQGGNFDRDLMQANREVQGACNQCADCCNHLHHCRYFNPDLPDKCEIHIDKALQQWEPETETFDGWLKRKDKRCICCFHPQDIAPQQLELLPNCDFSFAPKILTEETKIPNSFLRLVAIDVHAQGMKADFTYGDWTLAQNESLEIDPDTATLDDPTEDGYIKHNGAKYAAPDYIAFGVSGPKAPPPWDYWRGYAEWEVSGIPDGSSVTDTVFKYEGEVHHASASNSDIRAIIANQPSTHASGGGAGQAIEVWTEIGTSTGYVLNDAALPVVAANQSEDLGAQADTDLENQLASDWFAIGFKTQETEEPPADTSWWHKIYSEEEAPAPTPKPTLYVEYTPPAVGLENKSANMGSKMVAAGLI